MALFGEKLVLKKEYFKSCYDLNKYEISSLRKQQGFNVSTKMELGALIICAEKKKFMGSFQINHKINFDESRESEFYFFEVFTLDEVMSFLRQNFIQVPNNVRFLFPDGIKRDYYIDSFYLPDGTVLARIKNPSGNKRFSFETISKDRISK